MVVVCVHAVVGKTKFLVQFGYGQNKVIHSSPLVLLISKKEVGMDEPLSNSPKITR